MLRRHAFAGSVFQEPVKQRSGQLSVFAKCRCFLTDSLSILCSCRPDKWLNQMTLASCLTQHPTEHPAAHTQKHGRRKVR